jgi:hypothetical protein
VRESVFEGKLQPPKTQKAVRTISLGPRAIAPLTAHQQRVSRRAPEDLVFGNRKGDPLGESKLLRNVLQPAAASTSDGGGRSAVVYRTGPKWAIVPKTGPPVTARSA